MFDFGAADLAETDAQKTFRSHANYLRAIATMISDRPFRPIADALSRTATRVAAFPAPKPGPVDEAELRGCLTRAWGTEMLLAIGRQTPGEDELLRLINSWGVVQAYYAAYSTAQALIVAEGRSRPTSHQQTQRQAVGLWVTRSVSVEPWSFAMGSPAAPSTQSDGSINGPGRPILDVHPWSACTVDSCWDLAAKALRTTRKDGLNDALKKRRKKKRAEQRKAWAAEQADRLSRGLRPLKEKRWSALANLSRPESEAVELSVRPYTVLDYLYRLRVKANYEDAAVFTEGPDSPGSTLQVASDLELITAATLFAHELRVGRLVGRQRFFAIADRWLATNPSASSIALAARRGLLQTHL